MSRQNGGIDRPPGSIYIYIDNANLWIQGQKTYAEKKRLRVSWDPTWRFDVGRLQDILLANSGLTPDEKTFEPDVKLYGSTPPPVDTVWMAIEKHKVTVKTFPKSFWNKREKQVDSELIADSTDQASDAYHKPKPAVFIIVSGDRDVRSAVVKITKRGFPVHLWSWANGLAQVFRPDGGDKEINWSLFRVHLLDDHLEEVGFHASKFRIDRADIHGHSIVVLDPLPRANRVEDFLQNLRVPVYRYEFEPKRPDASSPDLAIIPVHARAMKLEELDKLFEESKEVLEKKGLRVLSYVDYKQQYLSKSVTGSFLALSNRFHELPIERGEEDDDDDDDNYDDDDKKNNNTNNISSCSNGSTLGSGHRSRGIIGIKNDGSNDARRHMLDSQARKHSSPSNASGSDGDGFIMVDRGTQKQNQYRKREERLATRCYWRVYCKDGLNCNFGHTKDEEEYFKTYGPKKAKKYKKCTNRNCIKGKMCSNAHGDEELFCPTCGKVGKHEMQDCDKRRSSSP
ncbi:hypothetical protein VTH82DRAFT_6321 [Thermothelomyces myriococcoides]